MYSNGKNIISDKYLQYDSNITLNTSLAVCNKKNYEDFYGFHSNYSLSELITLLGPYITCDQNLIQLILKNALINMSEKEKKISSETIANIITELVNHQSNEYRNNNSNVHSDSFEYLAEFVQIYLNYQVNESLYKESYWNYKNVIKNLLKINSEHDILDIIIKLDKSSLYVDNQDSFNSLIWMLVELNNHCNIIEYILYKDWNCKKLQLSLLYWAVTTEDEQTISLLNYTQVQGENEKIPTDMVASLDSPKTKIFICVDTYQLLFKFATLGLTTEVTELLEYLNKLHPKIFLIMTLSNQELCNERVVLKILQRDLPEYIIDFNANKTIIEVLFTNKCLFLELYYKLWNANQINSSLLSEIAHLDISMLICLTHSSYLNMNIKIAFNACYREFLNFDKWIKSNIKLYEINFVNFIVHHFKGNIYKDLVELNPQNSTYHAKCMEVLDKYNINIPMLASILDNITQFKIKFGMPHQLSENVRTLVIALLNIYPELLKKSNQTLSSEENVNLLLSKYYKQEWNLEQFKDYIEKLRQGSNPNDTEIFSCMAYTIWNEVKNFNKYDDRELMITTDLFSYFIYSDLFPTNLLNDSLNLMLNYFRDKKDSKTFQIFFNVYKKIYIKHADWPILVGIFIYLYNIEEENLKSDYAAEWDSSIQIMTDTTDLPSKLSKNYKDIFAKVLKEEEYDLILTELVNRFKDKFSIDGIVTDQYQKYVVAEEEDIQEEENEDVNKEFEIEFEGLNIVGHIPSVNQVQESNNTQNMSIDHALGVYGVNNKNNNNISQIKNSKLMSNNLNNLSNPLDNEEYKLPDQDASKDSIVKNENLKFNKSFSPTATFKEIRDDKKQMKPNSQGNAAYNYSHIYNSSAVSNNNPKPKNEVNKPKPEYSILNSLYEEIDSQGTSEDQVQVQNIINQITEANINEMSNKIINLVHSNYDNTDVKLKYFAHYLVVKKIIKVTVQYHAYEKLIIMVQQLIPEVQDYIISELYRVIKIFLENEATYEEKSMDKKYLNNLGSFLGMMTLKRDRPIDNALLDLKQLLITAYHSNRIYNILQFVIRIIESTKHSTYFKDYNCPYTNIVLLIIQEIYFKFNTQHNLNLVKTNIQVFFYAMGYEHIFISMNPRSNYLAYITPQEELDNSNYVNKSNVYNNINYTGNNKKSHYYTSIYNSIKISDSISQYYNDSQDNFKLLITLSIERALKEITQPVVERSYLIANTTTQYLVSKDFNYEYGNNNTLYKESAVNMSHHLSSNLALVTCREPLRISLNNFLTDYFKSNNDKLKEDAQVDNLIKEIINDNLDVGCNCIVKQVQEKNFPDFEMKWNTDIFKDISKEIQVREDTLPDNLKPHQVRNLKNKNYIEFQKRDFELKKKLNSEMLSLQDEFNMYPLGFNNPNPLATQSSLLHLLALLKECVDKYINEASKDNMGTLIADYKARINTILFNKQNNIENLNQLLTTFVSWFVEAYNEPSEQVKENRLTNYISLFKEFKNIIQSSYNASYIEGKSKATLCKSMRDCILREPVFKDSNLRCLNMLLDENFVTLKDIDMILNEIEDDRLIFEYIKQLKISKDDYHLHLCNTMEKLNRNPNLFASGGLMDGNEEVKFTQSDLELTKELRPAIRKFVEDFKDEILMWVSYNQKVVEKFIEDLIGLSEKIKSERTNIEKCYSLVLFEMLQYCFKNTNSLFKKHGHDPDYYHYIYLDTIAKLIFACLTYYSNFKNFDNNLFVMLMSFFDILIYIFKMNYCSANFKQLYWLRLFMSIFNEFSLIEELRNILTIKYQIFRQIVKKLMEINPNRYPKFAFGFFEVVSYKKFFPFLKDKSEDVIPLLQELITFVSELSKQDSLKDLEAFRAIKECLHRVVYMIAHDFPELLNHHLYSILSIIPPEMIQLKNIILSEYQVDAFLKVVVEYNERPHEAHEFATQSTVEENVKERAKEMKLEYIENMVMRCDKKLDELEYSLLKKLNEISNESDRTKLNVFRLVLFYLLYNHLHFIKDDSHRDKTKHDKEITNREYRIIEHCLMSRSKHDCELFIIALVDLLGQYSFITCKGLTFLTKIAVEVKRQFVKERIYEEIFLRAKYGEPVPTGIKLFIIQGNKASSSLKFRESLVVRKNVEYQKILDKPEYKLETYKEKSHGWYNV